MMYMFLVIEFSLRHAKKNIYCDMPLNYTLVQTITLGLDSNLSLGHYSPVYLYHNIVFSCAAPTGTFLLFPLSKVIPREAFEGSNCYLLLII